MLLVAKLAALLLFFLIALRRGVDLGIVLAAATAAVLALFPIPPLEFLRAVARGVASRDTANLVAVVAITIALGRLLSEAGTLRLLTRSLSDLIPDYRLVLALPPAIVGLLPMPAGALVSAPLVDDAARERSVSPEARTFINYWFRHLWEYIWPLYPGLIIGAAILEIPIRRFALVQYPLTLAAIAVGLAWLLRHVPRDRDEEARARDRGGAVRGVLAGLWPFLAILAGVFALRLPMLAALSATTLLVALASRLAPRRLGEILARSLAPRTLLLLIAVMAFKEALKACRALDGIPAALDAAGIPGIVPLCAAPFLVGLLTGVNQAYVAITFPMLAPLMAGAGAGTAPGVGAASAAVATLDMTRVMLAYVSGFLGILLSPTHLCLVLTREYFAADFRKIYGILAAPVGALFVAMVVLFVARGV